jgi:DUF3102 family protein
MPFDINPDHTGTRQAIRTFIETGQLLIEAKAELEHGEWLKMIRHGVTSRTNVTNATNVAAASKPLTSR